jgi:hypothetical protein
MGNTAKTVPFLLEFPSRELRTELHKETLDASCEARMTVSEHIISILRQRDKILPAVDQFEKLGDHRAPFFLKFYDKALRDKIKIEAKAAECSMGEYMVAILKKRALVLR